MDARIPRDPESIPDLFQRTFGNAAALASNLGQLAVSEMSAGIGSVAKGVGAVVAGLGAALIGLLFLLHAAVAFLVLRGFSEAASYAMVGGGIFVVGALAITIGVILCTRANPVPRRTIREVRSLFGQQDVVG